MAGHTRGPWEAVTFAIYDANRKLIAHVGGTMHPVGTNVPIQEANARLIAAAPELLEACRIGLELLEHYGGCDQVDAMRAAIAKAEGTK